MSGIAIIIQGADFSGSGNGRVHERGAIIPVQSIIINGSDSVNGSETYYAELEPNNTTQTGIIWSITNGSEYATIDSDGVLTALEGANTSLVTIRCTSADNPTVYAEKNIYVTKEAQPVTNGLTHNFDAFGCTSAQLTNLVDSSQVATFNGTPSNNYINITTTLDGNTTNGSEWEQMLVNKSVWTLEVVFEAKGWDGLTTDFGDIYHDATPSEINGRTILAIGKIDKNLTQYGGVCFRYNSAWQKVRWDNFTIDWNVPHVVHFTREADSTNQTYKLYIDGVFISQKTLEGYGSGVTAGRNVVFLASKGDRKLYAIRAYDRALTSEEVAYNFNYNNQRYGLNLSNNNG